MLYVGRPGALHAAASLALPSQAAVGQPTDLGPDAPYVSPQGWVAFISEQLGARTVYVWDGQAARRVAGAGDTIGGWTVTSLDMAGENAPGATALNGLGQLVFRAFAGSQGGQSEIVLASLAGTQPPAALPAWLGQQPAPSSGPALGGSGSTPASGGTPSGSGPAVSAVSPSSGSDWGGDSVTISGSGFTAAATVAFGPYNFATVAQVSADGARMTVTTPPDLDGPVDVTVTTAVGTSAQAPVDRFTYQPPAQGGQSSQGCNQNVPAYSQPGCPMP